MYGIFPMYQFDTKNCVGRKFCLFNTWHGFKVLYWFQNIITAHIRQPNYNLRICASNYEPNCIYRIVDHTHEPQCTIYISIIHNLIIIMNPSVSFEVVLIILDQTVSFYTHNNDPNCIF